jgi:hypothetical protein
MAFGNRREKLIARDTMDYNGAFHLAKKIADYLTRKTGKVPAVRIEPVFFRISAAAEERAYYVVRSNMIGGFPQ